MLRWGLIGCKQQSIEILTTCIAANIAPQLVVTLPNTPQQEIKQLANLAKKAESNFFVTDNLNAISEQINDLDIMLVCRYILIAEEIFSLPKLGSLNIHSALLPNYRGVHPVSWALIRGEKYTGVTIHYIDKGIDTGAIVLQTKTPINNEDNIWSLTDKLNMQSKEMTCSLLLNIKQTGKLASGYKQQSGDMFYARRRIPADGRINWQQPCHKICNLVRALQDPLPAAFSFTQPQRRIEIMRCKLTTNKQNTSKSAGTILSQSDNYYNVQCIDGILAIATTQELSVGACLQ